MWLLNQLWNLWNKLDLSESKFYQESIKTSVDILDELKQLDGVNKLEQLDDNLMKMYSDLKKGCVFKWNYEEFKKIYIDKEKNTKN